MTFCWDTLVVVETVRVRSTTGDKCEGLMWAKRERVSIDFKYKMRL